MHLYCKKSYLLDLLAVKNLPILGSLYQVLVFGDTSNGTFSYDHVHMSGPWHFEKTCTFQAALNTRLFKNH